MLLNFKCVLGFILITWMIVIYVYAVNARRANDDPKKRDYHPLAVIISPITLPIFLTIAAVGFVLLALFFVVFLVFFAIVLIALRRPFLLRWWDRFAMFIGDPLLRINTYFIRLALRPFRAKPYPIPQQSPIGNP